MGWVPINQLLIAALSPGPALGQARTAPPPAPDLSPGDTGTQPWGLGDSDLSWEKCTSSPSPAGVWSGRSSHLPPDQAPPQRGSPSCPRAFPIRMLRHTHLPHGVLGAHAPLAPEEFI